MSADGKLGAKAQIDFHCLDSENCDGVIKFNLAEICDEDFQAVCPKCHRAYELDEALRNKLTRMLNLVAAIREAEDIGRQFSSSNRCRCQRSEDTVCTFADEAEYAHNAEFRR